MPKARWGRGPGVPPQTEKRGLYIKLMSQGMSNKAACRTVGINIRTGKRWRHGRKRVTRAGKVKLYPPVAAIPVISPRFLSEDERIVIADSVLAGRSVARHSATAAPQPVDGLPGGEAQSRSRHRPLPPISRPQGPS